VAGARTVVASLWNINDASTAELMVRFYHHLKGDDDAPGKTTDEALRAAQLELLRGEYPSPHFWAPFQVIGDWK
jgi:CHAT domain-containing protein